MSIHSHSEILVALVGQPNCGKSTIFSRLTGSHQKIANYAGVTVEKKSARFKDGTTQFEVVDLPGTYSLDSFTQEEQVTRDFLILEQPEVVVVVIDAANFRRHLYLLLQILQMQIPVVLCLNMIDVAARRGLTIDQESLRRELRIPVISTNGVSGEGVDELRKFLVTTSQLTDHAPTSWSLNYDENIESLIEAICPEIAKREHLVEDFSTRWIAIKLLEKDRFARRIVQHHTHDDSWNELLSFVDRKSEEFEQEHDISTREALAAGICRETARLERKVVSNLLSQPHRLTDAIDSVLCHPVRGLFALSTILFLSFQFVFWIADGLRWIPLLQQSTSSSSIDFIWYSPVNWCAVVFGEWLPAQTDYLLGIENGTFRSFLHDGVFSGISGILQFVPLIFGVFILIAILEQCGLIARISVVLDRLVRHFGIPGQSVLPMILAGGIMGGCAVPAIAATRTMKDKREKLLTILIIPMMNCGAKIPIYAVLIAAFFSAYQGIMMAVIILISWGGALLSAWILSRTCIKGDALPLLVELPSYLVPSPRVILYQANVQTYDFVKKAGTIILAINIILWGLLHFPQSEELSHQSPEKQAASSYAGRIGSILIPISQFAGFDWRDNIALLGGFAAKEVIVSSLNTLYNEENQSSDGNDNGNSDVSSEVSLSEKLRQSKDWNMPKGVAMILFVMFYAPCAATCVCIWRETKSFMWMLFAVGYNTLFAFILAVFAYQIGHLLW
ncbi:MAG: ferrous iron transport protein B [Thermoguttaceae bacterium]